MDYDDDDAADGICQCTQLSSDANYIYIYYIYLYFRRYIKIFVQGSCKPLGWKIPHYVVICDIVGILLAIKCLQIEPHLLQSQKSDKKNSAAIKAATPTGGVLGRMGIGDGLWTWTWNKQKRRDAKIA